MRLLGLAAVVTVAFALAVSVIVDLRQGDAAARSKAAQVASCERGNEVRRTQRVVIRALLSQEIGEPHRIELRQRLLAAKHIDCSLILTTP